MDELILTGAGLTVEDVAAVARDGLPVALSVRQPERMRAASELAARLAEGDQPVYGLNTGVGALRGVRQSAQDAGRFTRLTIQSHRTSHGDPLPGEVGRAALLHRVNALCRGPQHGAPGGGARRSWPRSTTVWRRGCRRSDRWASPTCRPWPS